MAFTFNLPDIVSTYFKNTIIGHVLQSASASGSSLYAALYRIYKPEERDWWITAELSGSGYNRIGVSGSWLVNATTGSATNSDRISFPIATADWKLIPTHLGLVNDISISACYLFLLPLSPSPVIGTNQSFIREGDTFVINPETVSIQVSGMYSYYLSGKLLEHYLNDSVYYSPGSSIFLALYNTNPDLDDTGGVEVSGTGYNRFQIDDTGVTSPCWVSPSSGSTTNLRRFLFHESVPDLWGSIVGACIRDHPTAGNLLLLGNVYPPVYVKTPDGFKFEVLDYSIYPYIVPTIT